MKQKTSGSSGLAIIWGDTVSLRHLAGAMLIGMVLGISFYKGGLYIIVDQFSGIPANLHKSVGLLFGIVGCLIAAVISARLFPPKRVLSEQQFSPEERERVLKELQVDIEQEAEDMKTMSPAVLKEMEELQLLELFRKTGEKSPENKEH